MNNKAVKIVYWISTGLLAAFILMGVFFINSKAAKDGTAHLQIPNWLAMEVGIGQPIGALLLIIPWVGKRIKEWAYVAIGIVYISALIGHLAIDGIGPEAGMAFVLFLVLLVSYGCYHSIHKPRRHYS
jgi:hypothetical protein